MLGSYPISPLPISGLPPAATGPVMRLFPQADTFTPQRATRGGLSAVGQVGYLPAPALVSRHSVQVLQGVTARQTVTSRLGLFALAGQASRTAMIGQASAQAVRGTSSASEALQDTFRPVQDVHGGDSTRPGLTGA